MRIMLFAVACAIAGPAAAVTSVTYDFGGGPSGGTDVASKVATAPGSQTLTATARKFSVAPRSLTNLGQTRNRNAAANSPVYTLRATEAGIGVTGAGSNEQLDTNFGGSAASPLREGILFTSNIANFSLQGLKLSSVDGDDTLQVYGVNADGSFVDFGYAGVIRSTGPNIAGNTVAGSSLGGFATGVNTPVNSGTVVLTFNTPTAYFSRYFLTTRFGGDVTFMGTTGQGYRIDAVTGAVPEPTTWALLIVGFGMVGLVSRRRRIAVAA